MTTQADRPPGVPVLYSPEQAAEWFPKKTANWLRTQARNAAIPCTRMGRTIMFSEADLAEIARMSQQRPKPPATLTARTPRRRRTTAAGGGDPVLKAKVPPRKRKAA